MLVVVVTTQEGDQLFESECLTPESLKGAEVVVKMPAWLMNANAFASRELQGVVERESDRGLYVVGHASTRPSSSCHRCRRQITNPVSLLVGYGPDCSEMLGIPRDMPEDLVAEVRSRVAVSTAWQGWLPKSKIDVEVIGRAFTPEPEATQEEGTQVPQVKLTVVKNKVQIQAPFAWKDRIKDDLPGRAWDKAAKVWTVPATPSGAVACMTLFTPELCSTDLAFDALIEKARTRIKVAEHKTADELPEIPSTATPAWLHQKQAYWFGEQLDSLGLLMDMATGKSKVVVDLIANRGHLRTLIIAPPAVVNVWPKQFRVHAVDPPKVVAPRIKTSKGSRTSVAQRAEEIAAALKYTPASQPLVCVVNYDSIFRTPMDKLLLDQQWDFIVLDESHRIKAPGGKTSMYCGKLGKKAANRAILTGTPMPHSPLDVYAQYRFLDPGIFGTSFATFRARYALMGGFNGHEVLGYQRQDELAEKMYSIAFRVMATDVLNLIPPIHEDRFCTLEPAARKIYADLYDNMVADVGTGQVVSDNALVRLLRLQQVTSGAMPVDDPDTGDREMVVISEAKKELLADVMEDFATDEPVVVFCRFTHELKQVEAVCEKQGRRYGELSGPRKDGLTDDSTMRDDIDVLGCQIASGGVGIDLTRARYVIYMSTGHNNGDYEQSLARVQRPGQERQVVYYHLHCEDTIDEGVAQALANRQSVVEFVMGLGK